MKKQATPWMDFLGGFCQWIQRNFLTLYFIYYGECVSWGL